MKSLNAHRMVKRGATYILAARYHECEDARRALIEKIRRQTPSSWSARPAQNRWGAATLRTFCVSIQITAENISYEVGLIGEMSGLVGNTETMK